MIASLLGRRVPSGGLPHGRGGDRAERRHHPRHPGRRGVRDAPLSRYMTVAGRRSRGRNYKVRLGMRLADIVEECGGFVEEPAKIVMGGPMCGVSVPSLDMPVVKGTSGVLFLTRKEARTPNTACIRCGACVAACPMNLLPCDLGNAVEKNRPDLALKLNPRDCIMCGCCSYVCPSRRPLSHFIKLAQERTKPDTVAKA